MRLTTSATTGRTTISSTTGGGANAGIDVSADTAGASGGNIAITYDASAGNGALAAAWAAGDPNKITVSLKTSSWAPVAGVAVQVGANAGDTIAVASDINGSRFDGLILDINSIAANAETATYDYATNMISVDLTGAAKTVQDLEDAINEQLGALFTATAGAGAANAVTKVSSNAVGDSAGTDGGLIDAAANTATLVAAAIAGVNGGASVDATATGTGASAVTAFTHYATFGSENAGLATDPNNGIQFLAPDGASELPITFQTNGANQSLSISYTSNTVTNGYSTAYVQGANANSTIKVTALNQGTQYDGVAISYQQSTLDRSVVWDEENKEIKVYNDFDGGAVTAADVITQFDAALGAAGANLFDASMIDPGDATSDDGVVQTGENGTTTGGNQYTGITINLATDANRVITSTAAEVVTAVNADGTMQGLGISASNLGSSDGTGLVTTGSTAFTEVGVTKANAFASGTTVNRGGQNAQLTLTAKTAGALYDDISIVFRDDAALAGGGDEYMSYNAATKEFNIYINSGTSTLQNVYDNFTTGNNPTEYGLFTMTKVGTGAGTLYSTDTGTMTGGVVDSGTSDGGVALAENYDLGDVVGTGLDFLSVRYGASEFVSVKALEGTFQTTNAAGEIKDRDVGTDANVRLNGIQAITDGLDVSINTSVLDLSFTLASTAATTDDLDFRIISGGAQFQLGPDVVSNQQARLGIRSLSTAKLGGVTGRLFKLRSGEEFDLNSDVKSAASVVDEVITQVTTLRGRLGAFQKTTLDSNIASLKDALENLTDAESSIRDADFAAESASLTRAQILVQSGISVLSMANSNPQNVLALLR